MKITAQEEYGLRCLLRLARVEDGHALTIPEIAADEGLSAAYVAKLLAVLRHAGFIESVRGRTGGYRLERAASEIGLGSVLKVLGEPLFENPGYCQRHAGSETDGACVHLNGCTLRALWLTLEHWMSHLLDQVTLADLLQGEQGIADLLRSRLSDALIDSPSALMIPLSLTKE